MLVVGLRSRPHETRLLWFGANDIDSTGPVQGVCGVGPAPAVALLVDPQVMGHRLHLLHSCGRVYTRGQKVRILNIGLLNLYESRGHTGFLRRNLIRSSGWGWTVVPLPRRELVAGVHCYYLQGV